MGKFGIKPSDDAQPVLNLLSYRKQPNHHFPRMNKMVKIIEVEECGKCPYLCYSDEIMGLDLCCKDADYSPYFCLKIQQFTDKKGIHILCSLPDKEPSKARFELTTRIEDGY